MKNTHLLFVILSIFVVGVLTVSCTQNKPDYNIPTTKAQPSQLINLENGATFSITATEVLKTINGKEYKMFGYNGMIPGPTLKVNQGSTITVTFTNDIDQETTIHWHGLRHDIKNDGVVDISQKPVKPGEKFTYTLFFPDAGIYWYHPHVREDRQQDLGLAGNILVVPKNQIYNSVNQEEILMIDDILIDSNGIVPFQEEANFALMGRFGNVMLLNGKTDYALTVAKRDVVRFYLTNAANTRPFKISIPGVQLKLIGSDLGLYEQEQYVDEIIIMPGERYIVEAYFKESGSYTLLNVNPSRSYNLGAITVSTEITKQDYSSQFLNLKDNSAIIGTEYLSQEPDYTLRLTVDSAMMGNGMHGSSGHRMPDGTMMGSAPENGNADPIEWEDTMRMMNSQATSQNTKWILRDEKTGEENMDIDMNARIGDKLKIRIFNDPQSMHPMQHPIHLHGQRFVILAIDGKPVENKVWKDTVLVPVGSNIDILVDVTNPGEWMLHCHISEHLEAGMMAELMVDG